MRIAIFGAGAIGGLLGVKLHQAGAEISLIARGEHLAAIRASGLTLRSEGQSTAIRPFCTDDASRAGPQDAVIVTLKAHALAAAAESIASLLGPRTALVTAINGIPYWYFYRAPGSFENRTLESVDPGGAIWRRLPPEHAIGCVVYPGAEIVEPGVVAHVYGNRIFLGEPDGSKSARVEALSDLMTEAGFDAPARSRIRDDVWLKLWGNLAFNPLSALTQASLERLAHTPGLRETARTMMGEAQAVAEAFGVQFPITLEERIDVAGKLGPHKTSMLQDLERGRPMEIDALLGAVVELAGLAGKPVPFCRAILALLREVAGKPPVIAAKPGHEIPAD